MKESDLSHSRMWYSTLHHCRKQDQVKSWDVFYEKLQSAIGTSVTYRRWPTRQLWICSSNWGHNPKSTNWWTTIEGINIFLPKYSTKVYLITDSWKYILLGWMIVGSSKTNIHINSYRGEKQNQTIVQFNFLFLYHRNKVSFETIRSNTSQPRMCIFQWILFFII